MYEVIIWGKKLMNIFSVTYWFLQQNNLIFNAIMIIGLYPKFVVKILNYFHLP